MNIFCNVIRSRILFGEKGGAIWPIISASNNHTTVSDLLLKQTRSLNVGRAPMDGENEERNVGNAKCVLKALAQESTT